MIDPSLGLLEMPERLRVPRLNRLGSAFWLEAMSLYLRRAPGDFGRWRLLRKALPLSQELLQGQRLRTIRTRHGFRMRVNLGDWLGRHVFVAGDYEYGTARLIRSLLKSRDLFVDVGANVGFFTLLGARCVGSRGSVFAFEPLDELRRELLGNVRRNQYTHVTVRGEAVSDRTGVVPYYAAQPNHLGCSSLRRLDQASDIVAVRTVRLDEVLPRERRIRLIKIDVEGAELRVLEGMGDRLASDRPDIVVEITDSYLRGFGDSAEALSRHLSSLGYHMYLIGERGLVEVDPAQPLVAPQFNAFFTMTPRQVTR
jgi:FkbM family methyltransferase